MTTFKNTFHNSQISVRARVGEKVSHTTYRRVTEVLCGISDCKCGTFVGGEHVILRDTDGEKKHLVVARV